MLVLGERNAVLGEGDQIVFLNSAAQQQRVEFDSNVGVLLIEIEIVLDSAGRCRGREQCISALKVERGNPSTFLFGHDGCTVKNQFQVFRYLDQRLGHRLAHPFSDDCREVVGVLRL
jgi:hypothetical protein